MSGASVICILYDRLRLVASRLIVAIPMIRLIQLILKGTECVLDNS